MRLVFADFVAWDYTVDSAYERPLGGSQSAFCYLAEQMAVRGHEVYLVNNTSRETVARGVQCLPLATLSPDFWTAADGVVLLNSPKPGLTLRPLLRSETPLVLWTQHAHDQPAVQPLGRAGVRDVFTGFAFVSDWQRTGYEQKLGIDPAKARVMRNAISPSFRGQFAAGENILAAKTRPPVLAYTSTPYRGLDLLLHLFPDVRRRVPGIVLRVYSSMQVYQMASDKDENEYGLLYEQCRETDGIEYVGSLPQPELARQLREATLLAYPNHFAETSCIAVMEAMAAGCRIVTSDLGALAETTAGFGRLIPVPTSDDWLDYSEKFTEAVVRSLDDCGKNPHQSNELLSRQVAHVNAEYLWERRAAEWEAWLQTLTR